MLDVEEEMLVFPVQLFLILVLAVEILKHVNINADCVKKITAVMPVWSSQIIIKHHSDILRY